MPYSTYRYRILNDIPLDQPTVELLQHGDDLLSVPEWSKKLGCDRKTLYDALDYRVRDKGMTKEDALEDIIRSWS